MPFTAFSSAGVASVALGIVDLNGIPWGATGIPIVGGSPTGDSMPLVRMPFAKKFGGLIPNPVRATAIGDNNRNRHEYLFNPAQMGEISVSQHVLDLDQYAGLLGLKKVTDGNANEVLIQSNAPVNTAQAVILVNVDTQEAGLTNFGLKKFAQEWYPLTTLVPLLANLQEVAPAEWVFYGIPTQANQTPWGTPFSIATHGATRAGGFLTTSDYPMVLEAFKATGAETSITLTYTPATPAATYVIAWKFASGVWSSETISSVSGKVANVSALSANDIIVLRYESTDWLQTA